MDIKRLLRKETPAPLWKRVVAYLIDSALLALILSPFTSFDSSFSSFSTFASFLTSSSLFASHFFFLIISLLCISLFYWSFLEYHFQQTLGKYFLHITVQSEGKALSFKQCLLRNVTKLSSLLLFADTLYLFFSHGHQRYSETLAKTEVIACV